MNSDRDTISLLALGDSYTIGEDIPPSLNWPNQLADAINSGPFKVYLAKPIIIAQTGWRTDELLSKVRAENLVPGYDYVSLLIGVNNQYQGCEFNQFKVDVEELIDLSVQLANGDPTKVLVLSIPDYGFTPFGEVDQPKISQEIDRYNEFLKEISESKKAILIDINPISKLGLNEPQLIASDALHPSADQYRLWVEQIIQTAGFD